MAVPVGARSTRGVGELVRLLLDAGVRRFMVGLGGSSTNDGGSGVLAALGLTLRDAAGRPVSATPETLAALRTVDAAGLDPRLAGCELRIMSDVNNPLNGERGRDRDLRPAEGCAAGRHRALRRGARALRAPRRGGARPLGRAAAGRGRGGRTGLRVPAPGRRVFVGRGGRGRPDRARRRAGAAPTGRSPARVAATGRRCWRRRPYVVARHAAAHGVPVTLVSGAVDAAALADLGAALRGLLRAAQRADEPRRVHCRRLPPAGGSRRAARAA